MGEVILFSACGAAESHRAGFAEASLKGTGSKRAKKTFRTNRICDSSTW